LRPKKHSSQLTFGAFAFLAPNFPDPSSRLDRPTQDECKQSVPGVVAQRRNPQTARFSEVGRKYPRTGPNHPFLRELDSASWAVFGADP